MECACIHEGLDFDWDYEPSRTTIVAKKRWRCIECGRAIAVGDKHEFFTGRIDGRWDKSRTCLDCVSVIDHLFCDWYVGQIWEDLEDHIWCSGIEVSWVKLAKLTPYAREKVCNIIEKLWLEVDKGEVV
jgi:hypothetical protein